MCTGDKQWPDDGAVEAVGSCGDVGEGFDDFGDQGGDGGFAAVHVGEETAEVDACGGSEYCAHVLH